MSETIQFSIQGMDCGSCVKQIEGAVGAIAGVESVKVSLSENNATVSFDPAQTSKAAVIEVVEDEGFDVPA